MTSEYQHDSIRVSFLLHLLHRSDGESEKSLADFVGQQSNRNTGDQQANRQPLGDQTNSNRKRFLRSSNDQPAERNDENTRSTITKGPKRRRR